MSFTEPLHPLVWMCALGALVALLLCIGYGMAGKKVGAWGYAVVAVILALTSAIASALTAGGYLTP